MRAIDLFAGAGGSSTGLTQAGLTVAWAGNHDPVAVRVHRANHPGAVHCTQDLQQADWREVPQHELLWASPSCQGHSSAATRGGVAPGRCARSSCTGKAPLAARGSAPAHDAMRSTAWAVVSAAEAHRPRRLIVENVREFASWVLYPAWRQALEALGYSLQELQIDAADLGAPQERRRLFVVGSLGRTPKLPSLPKRRRSSARDVVDLAAGSWRPLSSVPGKQHQRCLDAIERYGSEGAALVQAVTGHQGRSLLRPLPTITTKHQMGLVKREGREWVYRMLLLPEISRGMGLPRHYDWLDVGVSDGCRLAGNAVVPAVARWLAEVVS